ncbi:MAG TPA: Crp/Fnr family transcriptional regulator [Kofleriaceae bacterium]
MKRRTPADYRELLRAGRWFGAIPDALQDLLLANAKLRVFAKDKPLVEAFRASDGLFGVVDGSVIVRSAGDDERPAIVRMCIDPPSWFGEVTLMATSEHALGVEVLAAVETRVVFIAAQDFHALARARPEIWRYIAELAMWHVRLALTALFEAEQGSSLARVARRLALMAEGYGDYTSSHRVITLGQEALAMTLGQSRQTLSALLKQLERDNLIRIGYRKIEILDHDGLRRAT